MTTNLLISVKPRWAEKITSGEKPWELRKLRPREGVNKVIIYATIPVFKIICIATLEAIASGSIDAMWQHLSIKNHACVTENEFRDYYKGKQEAIALELSEVQHLSIPLTKIREIKPNFNPPQSYLYLDDDDPLIQLCIS